MWGTSKFFGVGTDDDRDGHRHGSRGLPEVLQQSQFIYAAPMQYGAPAVIFSAPSKPAAPAPVMEYISPTPAASYVSPAPAVYTIQAPAVVCINPALAVSHASPALTVDISLQLLP